MLRSASASIARPTIGSMRATSSSARCRSVAAGIVGRYIRTSLALDDGLPPNPERPFVLVVADPENAVAESDEADNTASFRKHVIGVVTHGGVQPADWIYGPAWQLRMGSNLRAEGYDDVIAFNWVSESRTPGAAAKQVPRLLKAILFATSQFPASDPVDLHLIGHSEGTVINSLVALRLRDEAPPSLEAGYLKVTMLDPHAANNAVAGQQYSVSNGLLGWYAKLSIDRFQERAKDPAVLVPDNVDDAEVFYQHTPVSEAQSNGGIYNLWGQVPVHGPAHYFDITGPGISHSGTFGVHDWYRLNIVPTLGDGSTFTRTNALTVAQAPETVQATDRGANVSTGRRPSFTGTAAPGATVRLIAVAGRIDGTLAAGPGRFRPRRELGPDDPDVGPGPVPGQGRGRRPRLPHAAADPHATDSHAADGMGGTPRRPSRPSRGSRRLDDRDSLARAPDGGPRGIAPTGRLRS